MESSDKKSDVKLINGNENTEHFNNKNFSTNNRYESNRNTSNGQNGNQFNKENGENSYYQDKQKQESKSNNYDLKSEFRYPPFKEIINQKLLETFSVADAKYDESCKCGKSQFAEITFHDQRKKIFKNENQLTLSLFEYVVVQADSGYDIGTVTACGLEALEKLRATYHNDEPNLAIVRHASHDDLEKYNKNNCDECTVIDTSRDLALRFNLDMKITGAEWQFDRQRLTIYFTAPQRIDFRELVKELARTFKTRIELRQISTREEAKRIGGMGPCGLNLCCSSFVSEFCHVTLDHARTQHLSNNVAKLSGYCGRLKCCLLYEHDIYVEVYDKFPPLKSKVMMDEGMGILTKVDVFKEIGTVYLPQLSVYRNLTKETIDQLLEKGKITPPSPEELRYTEKDDFNVEELKILEADY